jgi:hypothetical protein
MLSYTYDMSHVQKPKCLCFGDRHSLFNWKNARYPDYRVHLQNRQPISCQHTSMANYLSFQVQKHFSINLLYNKVYHRTVDCNRISLLVDICLNYSGIVMGLFLEQINEWIVDISLFFKGCLPIFTIDL